MSPALLLKLTLWSWLLAFGLVWGPGFIALQLKKNGTLPNPNNAGLELQQRSDQKAEAS